MNRFSYPLMERFCTGSFSANSGGQLRDEAMKFATPEEWQEAERWLRDYCQMLGVPNPSAFCFSLGGLADDGYEVHGMFAQEYTGEFYKDVAPTDERVKAPPWILLDRFY